MRPVEQANALSQGSQSSNSSSSSSSSSTHTKDGTDERPVEFERLTKCICSVAQLTTSTPQCCYNESQKLASRWQAARKKQGDLGALHHFIWVVETENWSILRQLELPFKLSAALQRPPEDPHDALPSEWDTVKAQSSLRLLQNALPLAQLNEELRAQFVTHQRLSGLPA